MIKIRAVWRAVVNPPYEVKICYNEGLPCFNIKPVDASDLRTMIHKLTTKYKKE